MLIESGRLFEVVGYDIPGHSIQLHGGCLGHPFPELIVVYVVHRSMLLLQEVFEHLRHIFLLHENPVENVRNNCQGQVVVVGVPPVVLFQKLLQLIKSIQSRFAIGLLEGIDEVILCDGVMESIFELGVNFLNDV